MNMTTLAAEQQTNDDLPTPSKDELNAWFDHRFEEKLKVSRHLASTDLISGSLAFY
jgi:hypothetical protein